MGYKNMKERSLEDLQQRIIKTDQALSRLKVVPYELGSVDKPSFQDKPSRGFITFNRRNIASLEDANKRLDLRKRLLSVPEKIEQRTIPTLERKREEYTAIIDKIYIETSLQEAKTSLEFIQQSRYATAEDKESAQKDYDDLVAGLRIKLTTKPIDTQPTTVPTTSELPTANTEQEKLPELVIDLATNKVFLNGKQKTYRESKQKAVLIYLARHPGQILSKESINEVVKKATLSENEKSAQLAIFSLRKDFETDHSNPTIFLSFREEGYMLNARARIIEEETPIILDAQKYLVKYGSKPAVKLTARQFALFKYVYDPEQSAEFIPSNKLQEVLRSTGSPTGKEVGTVKKGINRLFGQPMFIETGKANASKTRALEGFKIEYGQLTFEKGRTGKKTKVENTAIAKENKKHPTFYPTHNTTLPNGEVVKIRIGIKDKVPLQSRIMEALLKTPKLTLDSDALSIYVLGDSSEDSKKKTYNAIQGLKKNLKEQNIKWEIKQPMGPQERAKGQKAIYTLKQIKEDQTPKTEVLGSPEELKKQLEELKKLVEINEPAITAGILVHPNSITMVELAKQEIIRLDKYLQEFESDQPEVVSFSSSTPEIPKDDSGGFVEIPYIIREEERRSEEETRILSAIIKELIPHERLWFSRLQEQLITEERQKPTPYGKLEIIRYERLELKQKFASALRKMAKESLIPARRQLWTSEEEDLWRYSENLMKREAGEDINQFLRYINGRIDHAANDYYRDRPNEKEGGRVTI